MPPASGQSYGPSDILTIAFSEDVEADALSRLGLELDAIDVTLLANYHNQTLTLRPPSPLSTGQHELQLVEVSTDGSIVTRGRWIILVEQTFSVSEQPIISSVSGENSLNASYRLLDKNLDNPLDRLIASGSGFARARMQQGGLSGQINANYFMESERSRSATNKHLDLGEYTMSGSVQDDGTRYQVFGRLLLTSPFSF